MEKDRLNKLFEYKCGHLYWREIPVSEFATPAHGKMRNTRFAGKRINCKSANGYLVVRVDGKLLSVHAIIAAMFIDGFNSECSIDHIDGDRTNNKIENLRIATAADNSRNMAKRSDNTSGMQGISFNKSNSKWHAYISINRKRITIGYFDSLLDAASARVREARANGYSERHIFS